MGNVNHTFLGLRAKEMRENDKEMQKQSLEEKLKLRSEMKKTKKAKSPPTGKVSV